MTVEYLEHTLKIKKMKKYNLIVAWRDHMDRGPPLNLYNYSSLDTDSIR